MFQVPKKQKFKKFHKIKLHRRSTEGRVFCPKFGDYGLQAIRYGKLTAKQIEAGRLVVKRFSKKSAFLKINVYPFLSLTEKPTAARMGKGKGRPKWWVCPVKRGRIIYEISTVDGKFRGNLPLAALELVNRKLPLAARTVRLIY